jgi:hypothetical protein
MKIVMRFQLPHNIPLGITAIADAAGDQVISREAASQRLRRYAGTDRVTAEDAGQSIPSSMTISTTNADACAVCNGPVKGGFETLSYLRLGIPVTEVTSTPDRNFNLCSLCGTTICWACSQHPDSGCCNECYRQAYGSQDSVANDEVNTRAETNVTPTPMQFDQPPAVIPLDDKPYEPSDFATALTGRRELVKKLNQHRQVDVDDLRGRLMAISQKLTELADEFDEYFRDIDAGIIDVLSANTLDDARDSVRRFFS